ncbi:MAG TPA: hypothetical protein VGH87_20050 [Polyangiaceae bacterium]|nr:hypothetical protein [Polyangiaceae bacterium]
MACGTDVDLGGSAVTTSDGSATSTCGDLVGPTVEAGCKACNASSDDCQPNGCYGGYWCDIDETDCKTPPSTCP